MAERVHVDVDVHRQVLREIAFGHETYELVRDVAEKAASDMRRGAPVRTGAGRSSIRARAELGPDGWYATASWDEAHYYMGILNTTYRGFADSAITRIRYV